MLGLSEATASAIHALDEHWNGAACPMASRESDPAAGAHRGARADGGGVLERVRAARGVRMARERSGTWFDAALVEALCTFEHDEAYWRGLGRTESRARVAALEPRTV
jgi:hypothetical protein